MTATDLRLERDAVNALMFGTQAGDMVREVRSALDAGHFADPWCAAVAAAVVGEVDTSEPGALMLAVHHRLVATGTHRERDFWQLCLADVKPGTLNALPMLLHKLAEAAERRRLLDRLVALADTLERPGGPARVAEVLGMEVVA